MEVESETVAQLQEQVQSLVDDVEEVLPEVVAELAEQIWVEEEDGVVRMDGEELAIYGQMPGTGEWVVEKSVRLREAAAGLPGWKDSFLVLPARIVTVGDTFVVLSPVEETWLFSVELETMELEREHERNWHDGPAYPCALPWPPVIQACIDHADTVGGKRRGRRKR